MKLQEKNLFTALSVLTGLFTAFSFPKMNLFFLMWAALVPLFYVICRSSVKQSFFYAFLAGLAAHMHGVFFVLDSIFLLTDSYITALFFYIVLCLYFSLYWGVWGALVSFIKRLNAKPLVFVFISASLWVLLEYTRTYVLTGWPWTLLGYSQYLFTYIIQIAEFTGVYGVSFLIVLINGLLYFCACGKRKSHFIAAVSVFSAVFIFGMFRYNAFKEFGEKEYTVAAVQSNTEQYKKLDNSYREETFSKLEESAEKLSEIGADLNVWSESEIINFIPLDLEAYIFADKLAKTAGGFNIIGAPYLDGNGKLFGAVFHFDGKGGYVSMHTKNHLIPFGEYLPLGLSKYLDIGADNVDLSKAKGYDAVVFNDGEIYAGSLICTENFFPALVRKFVLGGAKVLTSNSNDAWFFDSSGPYKHFSANVFRAVESRKAVIAAANTGVSAIIDAAGKITVSTRVYERAVISGTFRQNGYLTFYMRFGDVFTAGCMVCILLFAAAFLFRKLYVKNRIRTKI